MACHYAAVLIDRTARLARPYVCLSVTYWLITTTKRRTKTKIGVYVYKFISL